MSDEPETIELSKLREIIRLEYRRWAADDESAAERDFVIGCSMGAMGACANILCAAEGFKVMEYQPEGTDANSPV
jgi:hypothetical protein